MTANNCVIWPYEIEFSLHGKRLWKYVSESDVSSTSTSETTMADRRGNQKDVSLTYVMMSIDTSFKVSVMNLRDLAVVWAKLKKDIPGCF